MTAIWQERDGEWRLLAPSGFDDEGALHDRVEEAPQLLPLSGSPQITVLGREVRLGGGYADLIAVEGSGRPVVIEIKLARNSEARRAVVAQVLAYAAFLFRLSLEDLEGTVLSAHLVQRGYGSMYAAAAAANQGAGLREESFNSSLRANLAEGRFRLVLVLDEAPHELVSLIGYLEAMTPELVIDLITVAVYDVGGSAVLVPQRVDPERIEQLQPSPSRVGSQNTGTTIDGVDEFVRQIDEADEPAKHQLLKLVEWASGLHAAGHLATLKTYVGPSYTTLLPRIPVDDAGLVTIYYSDTGGSITFWRSVFERRAPRTLARIERDGLATIGQGNVTTEVTDELLDALSHAYAEASSNALGRQSS